MAFFKVPEGCSSLSLCGEEVEIIDGVIEADKEFDFLINNGFTQLDDVVEETKKSSRKSKVQDIPVVEETNTDTPVVEG